MTDHDYGVADRAFRGRAVRYLAGWAGIRQFLDIGTGLPTADNTHELAQPVALVPCSQRRPDVGAGDGQPAPVDEYGGVARKP